MNIPGMGKIISSPNDAKRVGWKPSLPCGSETAKLATKCETICNSNRGDCVLFLSNIIVITAWTR